MPLDCGASEDSLKVPWTAKRSNQLILKEINSEYPLERLMLKLKPVLWPPDEKSRLTGEEPDAGKDWRQEEKGTTEDEMAGWHHWLNGHEFEQTLQDGEGQGSLACCSPWGLKESDMTERLNSNKGKNNQPQHEHCLSLAWQTLKDWKGWNNLQGT